MTIIKKIDIEQTEEKRFSKKYFILVAVSFFILVVFEIWINNTMVLYGERYENISTLERSLKTENQILENEIAKQSSLGNLASKSAELGFAKVESIQYIR